MHSGRSSKVHELKKLRAVNYFNLVFHYHTNDALEEYLSGGCVNSVEDNNKNPKGI